MLWEMESSQTSIRDQGLGMRACVTEDSWCRSFSYSVGSKLVMPPLTPLVLCSSHQSIILSYARAACSSWSKHPSEVGLPLRLPQASVLGHALGF